MAKAFVGNVADAKQVKEAKKKERFTRKDELDDIHFLLENEQGRRFLNRVLGLCRIYELSYTGSAETYFNEGMRNIGLRILADITSTNPQAYAKMLIENGGNEEVDDQTT